MRYRASRCFRVQTAIVVFPFCWCPVYGLLAAPEPVIGSGADATDGGVLLVLSLVLDQDNRCVF